MLRREVIKEELAIEQDEEDEETPLISTFSDTTVSDDDFKKMLNEADKTSVTFKLFASRAQKIKMEES